MKKLLSTSYSAGAFNIATLLLRICFGVLMISHGLDKMIHFEEREKTFINFMEIGKSTSIILVIFAEFFCALFIVLGLFTRFATVPLIITMSVALFKAHHGDVFGDGSEATLFLGAFLLLLLVGPGKISVDGLSGK